MNTLTAVRRLASAIPSINGVALQGPLERLSREELRERARTELLRQEAVRRGLLPGGSFGIAPTLDEQDLKAIDQMLMQLVPQPTPSEQECRRHYDAHKGRFMEGRQVHLRHILFAVRQGSDIHRLAVKAEEALLQLLRREVPAGTFERLARELSDCPSAANGGDLGWIGPQDCTEELANELFHQKNPLHGIGLRPRLVHSRDGLHIVEVLGRKQGRQLRFEQVRTAIAAELAQQSRATAVHQYICLLAGDARVEGVDLQAGA